MHVPASEKLKFLFIPVSSADGVGEYMRSLIIAEEIAEIWPDAEIHFLLSKEAPYAQSCPFSTDLLIDTPTKQIDKVNQIISDFKPNVVIFDASGRRAQLAHAKQVGAKVIFISQHRRKRRRGLKYNRARVTDSHWVVQPEYVIGGISVFDSYKLNWLNKAAPIYTGSIFHEPNPQNALALLDRLGLKENEFILFSSGSGGHLRKGSLAADEFAAAAAQIYQITGIKTVNIYGINYPNAPSEMPGVINLVDLSNADFINLLSLSKTAVLNGGDTLLQAITLKKPAIAVPVSKDQYSRIKVCEKKGFALSAQLTVKSITNELQELLKPSVMSQLKNNLKNNSCINGLSLAMAEVKRLVLEVTTEKTNLTAEQTHGEALPKRYLMYLSQNYSYAVLRPLQKVILARGGDVRWFLEGKEVNPEFLTEKEIALTDIGAVQKWQPDAVFVPGNVVPKFIPGVKIGVFHGFNAGKINHRGRENHFEIRHCFDLYCTHGDDNTIRFQYLSKIFKSFYVKETGWPAMDPLFEPLACNPYINDNDPRPVVLFCSTFSRSLSCAPIVYEEIKRLSKIGNWRWLVQFHPKMNQEIIKKYKALENENLHFVETDNVIPLLRAADVMLCDTSSILLMFQLQIKPVVAFRHQKPQDHLINITELSQIEGAIEKAISRPESLIKKVEAHCKKTNPYRDGLSSERVIDAADELIAKGTQELKPKPLNLIRHLKMRKKLGYWKFSNAKD